MAADEDTLAPRDFESLRGLIIDRRSALPRRLAQVAKYALDHPDEVAFGTAASIAGAADVQPSTLVRFAHQLGYEGFSDLQKVFQERLRGRNSSYEERMKALKTATEKEEGEAALVRGFLTAAQRSLQDFSNLVDPALLSRAVQILAGADTIYLLARRRSYPLVAHMAYAFGKLRVKNSLIASPNGIDPEIAAMASRDDAALAISFSPYAADSVGSGARHGGCRCSGDCDYRFRFLSARRLCDRMAGGCRIGLCGLPLAVSQHGAVHGPAGGHRRSTPAKKGAKTKTEFLF